jgi:hypothetical protein
VGCCVRVTISQSKLSRVLAPVAAAVLAVGVVLLVTALGNTQAGSATPWLNRPVPLPAPHAGRQAAACDTKAISVHMTRRGVVQDGSFAYVYDARNDGGRTCYISGYPRITIGGKTVVHGPDVLSVAPGNLRPDQDAIFAVTQTTMAGCHADTRNGVMKQTSISAFMSVGTRQSRVIGKVLINKCTMNFVSAIGLAPAEPEADALSRLSVRLNVPARAVAGQTLKFEVVLTNPTTAPIRLSPCPSYVIGVSAAREHAYRLNCANPLIAAGRSRVFDMEYALPAGTRAGLAKIGWLLLNPRRTGTGTIIHIVS